jgi:glyoxylase-like metal-dependent hydrolase (beta-lactamase superfamily II)
VEVIADDSIRVDLEHLGNPQVIAASLLLGRDGAAIVDPGPSSAFPTLKHKLAMVAMKLSDVRHLLLTHIHLDHAGAAGSIVAENPHIRVAVHERGAVHLARPGKLLESARRLYGEEMERLWGEFRAVPEENLQVLKGGEKIQAAGRTLEVEYTPGHASHHVSYFDTFSGIAFVGDTAGIRIAGRPYVMPPTPPPDIDLEQWDRSLELIAARKPEELFLTHFGISKTPEAHLAELRERLHQWAVLVRDTLLSDTDDATRASQFAARVMEQLQQQLSNTDATRYAKGAGLEMCWAGLARYWRKRGG